MDEKFLEEYRTAKEKYLEILAKITDLECTILDKKVDLFNDEIYITTKTSARRNLYENVVLREFLKAKLKLNLELEKIKAKLDYLEKIFIIKSKNA
jgi:hypothetical protein